jgi:ABC-type sulfate transport system permease component
MNDVTILDLFWLILKFLAALGLICLIGLVLFLVWAAVKRAAKTAWDIIRGRNASVATTVCFVLAVVALVTCVVFGVGYLHDHPDLHH